RDAGRLELVEHALQPILPSRKGEVEVPFKQTVIQYRPGGTRGRRRVVPRGDGDHARPALEQPTRDRAVEDRLGKAVPGGLARGREVPGAAVRRLARHRAAQ